MFEKLFSAFKKKPANIGVEHGKWGEDIAAKHILKKGWKILERNSRPCSRDRRLEIDIVAYDEKADTIIFVEVKQHKSHSEYERRLRSINSKKKRNMRIACRSWIRSHKWQKGFRFDVIEIFGTPEESNFELDHIERVNIFVPADKFVRWT